MALPEQLLLSDLLKRRVRCQEGLERGTGLMVWMHPPVHRVLGWVTKPSAFGNRRLVWRLNQLRGLLELEALVKGEPAETDQQTIERLPTLMEASLLDARRQPIGTLADAALELDTGRIRHYLVSRSDPRLPGSSRWRLSPDRIVDQQPGLVFTSLEGLDDLPLARASVRQEFLRRSRRWRDQMQEETSRLREQFQQAGDRFEERVEGWLEEPPWEGADESSPRRERDWEDPSARDAGRGHRPEESEPREEPWDVPGPAEDRSREPDWWDPEPADPPSWPAEEDPPQRRRAARTRADDPWI